MTDSLKTTSSAVWPDLTWGELEEQLLAHATLASQRHAIRHLIRTTRDAFHLLPPSQRFAELLAVFAMVLIPADRPPPPQPSQGSDPAKGDAKRRASLM